MDHGPALEPSLATEPFEVKPNLTFAFEAKPSTDFTPVYLDKPALATAAMNAGDYKLYVGGGAINRAFGILLREEQGLELDESNPKWPRNVDYARLHSALLSASRQSNSNLVSTGILDATQSEGLLGKLKLLAAFGCAGDMFEEDTTGATGSVFIDVFKPGARPLHNKNVAMLYVVGPKGDKADWAPGQALDKVEFLASIERLACRVMDVVAEYNHTWAGKAAALSVEGKWQVLPMLEEIRCCLVSGGGYKHSKATKLEVAKATQQGILRSQRGILASHGKAVTVTFTYDEDVFRKACD